MNIFLFFKFADFFPMFVDVLSRYPETMFPGPCRFFRRADVCNTGSDQVISPDMLDASFHVAIQETLAKNQEDLQK